MIRVYSFQEIPKIFNTMAPAGFLVSLTTNSISNLIKTTKGKEKLLALVQYSAELLKLTMQDYVQKNNIAKLSVSLLNAMQVEKSMKNGRKLMRVLMFTEDLGCIEKAYINREKLNYLDGFSVLLNIANIVYYILDNLVWCSDIGIISKFVAHANIRWKDTKDMSSVARCVLGLIISMITSFRAFDKIKSIRTEFEDNPEKRIKKDKRNYIKTCSFVDARREYRFKVLEVIINILRFFMLGQSLNFPVLKNFSKIFIAICGICATSLSIFNGLIGEQVMKIVEENQEEKTKEN